jgi:KUP system potassium uptake protein
LAITLGAVGVVYGDIGTSPLYAVNEIFFGHGHVDPTPENARGCISLVVWALVVVVTLKYVLFVLRADNDGEGGVFALYGLLHRFKERGLEYLLFGLMLAAGLLFGDGVITPAISVLSAVEGLNVVTPMFEHAIVPITIAILTFLFSIQFMGTEKVGRVFGPVLIVWFVVIAALGVRQIVLHPQILGAMNPYWGFQFLGAAGFYKSLLVLGSVMLTVTGGEALYADMGHFGKSPIRLGWFGLVFPSLLLNYLGQGAFLMGGGPEVGNDIFYRMVPHALVVPMVILATFATIIASQALISGAFSLASQGIGLGLLPRLRIVHTHRAHEGQIYVPFVNWALFTGCIVLVVVFGSSSALASAYGLAVSGVMVATSLAMIPLARLSWKWSTALAVGVFGSFAICDNAFLLANSLKLLEGGFVPLTLGVVLFVVMITWRWGRKATFGAYSSKHTMTMKELVEWKARATTFFDRNAILMVPKPLRKEDDNTPALLQLLLDRYGLLPKNLVFVEIVHCKVPYVYDNRYEVTVFQKDAEKGSLVSVTIKFGFLEDPNVERVLAELAGHSQIDLPADPHKWVVHVSLENLIPAKHTGLSGRIRLRIFSILRRLSQPAYYTYGLGNEVQLSAEIMPVKLM